MSSRGLRRELGLPGTVSVSVGVMAPTLAMSVTGAAAARMLGPAAPLAFVVAALGVGLVAYGFVRLSGQFAHAGSVYAFVGRTLGPRPGFVAGWALLGTYLVFPPVSIAGVVIFGRSLLARAGLADDADWYPLALVAWVVVALLARRGIRPTTRSVLLFEVVSVVLILVLVVVVLARVTTGARSAGPGGTSAGTSSLAAAVRLPPGSGCRRWRSRRPRGSWRSRASSRRAPSGRRRCGPGGRSRRPSSVRSRSVACSTWSARSCSRWASAPIPPASPASRPRRLRSATSPSGTSAASSPSCSTPGLV
jgi:hypothetical protein